MIKKLAITFGVVFLLVGLLGFVPGITHDEHLLGVFHVNAAHNIVHLLSGAAALMAGLASTYAARMFFRIFGLVYGLVAALGFVYGNAPIFGLISNNAADTWLHGGVALASLLVGFGLREEDEHRLRHANV